MTFSVTKTALDSFRTLYQNRTVLIISVAYAIVTGIVGLFISLSVLPAVSQLQIQLSNLKSGLASTTQVLSSLLPILEPVVGIFVGGSLLIFLITVFARGTVISAAYAGEKNDLSKAVGQAADRYLWLLGTYIAVWILILLGLIVLVIPGVYIGIKLSVAPVETIIAKKGIIESLKASWLSTDGRWWDVFFTLLLVGVLLLVFSVVSLVFSIISAGLVALIGTFLKMSVTVARTKIYQGISPLPSASRKRK